MCSVCRNEYLVFLYLLMTMGVTNGLGTVYLSGTYGFIRVIIWFVFAQSFVVCAMFSTSLFFSFLAIALSVLQLTVSNYALHIFKPFLLNIITTPLYDLRNPVNLVQKCKCATGIIILTAVIFYYFVGNSA